MSIESSSSPSRLRNFAIAAIAIVLAIALALGVRTQNSTASLESQASAAVPIDVALSNGKPTLMEFYANWCTSCQAMAPDLAAIKSQFGDRINFSMLNVDNTKWLPEISKYRVDGIPHFVWFDAKGQPIAQTVGEQPRSILTTRLTELLAGTPIANNSTAGEVSKFVPKVAPGNNSDPRAHGA